MKQTGIIPQLDMPVNVIRHATCCTKTVQSVCGQHRDYSFVHKQDI